MTEHVDERCEPEAPASGPGDDSDCLARIRASTRAGVVLVLVSTILTWVTQAQAQPSRPPRASDPAASTSDSEPSKPDGADAEQVPLADDSAAALPDATSAAGGAVDADAPWNQGVDMDRRRAARDVFRQANELARKRFFASAAAKYKQAIELWPHPAFAYNLALAQLQLDQIIEAHANLERALAHGPAPLTGRYEQARQEIARIESELSPIEVTCAEPGAHVMLDGKIVFTAPGAYRGVVRPGAHQIVATRRGLPPVVEQIVASPGERGSFAITFEYPEVDVAITTRRWAAWKSYAVVSTGAALLMAGAALDWHSTRLFDEHDRKLVELCPEGCMNAPPGLDDRQARAESEQRFAVIAYAVGGTVLVTGAIMAYLGRERVHHERVRQAPNAPDTRTSAGASIGSTALVPLVSPDGIGVSAAFRF